MKHTDIEYNIKKEKVLWVIDKFVAEFTLQEQKGLKASLLG